jgi:hypothetical protein
MAQLFLQDVKPTWGARPYVPSSVYKRTEKEWEEMMKEVEPEIFLDNWYESTFSTLLTSPALNTAFQVRQPKRIGDLR